MIMFRYLGKYFYAILCPLFLGVILALAADGFGQGITGKGTILLENDFVRLEFEGERYGLASMLDMATGVNHIQAGGTRYLLWELEMRSGMESRRVANTEFAPTGGYVRKLADGTQRAVMTWGNIPFVRERQAITVTVTVDLPPRSGIALWNIAVDNRSDLWGLWEIHFPFFSRFMTYPGYAVARPSRNWGQLYENVKSVERERYPSSQWPVQMMAAYTGRSGILLAAYDPESWLKSYKCEPGGDFYFITYPRDMAVAGSDFAMDWNYAIGVYAGQWFEGCKIYREWAEVNAPWMRKGKLRRRWDVPKSIQEIGLWMIGSWEFNGAKGTPEEMNQPLLDAQEYFGVPLGLHWYNWHQIRFDNEYPHYFPPKEGFAERVAQLVKNNILTMPYYNCRIWDYDLPDFPKEWALKDYLGEPHLEIYGTSSARLAPVCPGTEFMQKKVTLIADSLIHHYGVNAVYLDQGGSTPLECFDPGHGHPVGGGTYWVEGRRKTFEMVKETALRNGTGAAMTMEHFNEPYIDTMDGFLIWVKRNGMEVPMNTAIYSGWTIFWSSPAWLNAGDRSFVMVQGRDFIWGTQNGWMGFDLFKPEHEKKVAYLKKVGKYRELARKYLTYGELIQLVEPANDVPTVTELWPNHRGEPKNATLPSVMAALWKAENGNLGVFLVNFLEKENVFEYEINPAEFGLEIEKGGRYQFARLAPEGKSALDRGYRESVIERKEILEPWEIRVLEIYPVGY